MSDVPQQCRELRDSLRDLEEAVRSIHPEHATPALYADLQGKFVAVLRQYQGFAKSYESRALHMEEIDAKLDALRDYLVESRAQAWLKQSET